MAVKKQRNRETCRDRQQTEREEREERERCTTLHGATALAIRVAVEAVGRDI